MPDLAFDELSVFFFFDVIPLASIHTGSVASDKLWVVKDGNSDNRCEIE